MKLNKTTIILLFIFLFSFLFRFYQTSVNPPLLWDEAALGYNAFSILKTGKDEYGQTLPIIFKSFGDYKPGFYVYLTIPFVFLFGLNPISVRLPSILIGSLMPIFTYLLILAINPKSKKIGLLAAAVMAFNPYNIHFSRGAWETNILTAELILGSLFFFKYLNQKKHLFAIFSAVIFGSTFYTYQAGKLITFLLIAVLFLVNFKEIKSNIGKITLYFGLPLLLLFMPIIVNLLFSSSGNRLKVVSIFSYSRPQNEQSLINQEAGNLNNSLFQSSPIFYSRNILLRYFNHFSPKFLVFEGDWQNIRHSAPYIGVILYPSIIFLLLGILLSLSSKNIFKDNLFFLLWLLLAPIPSALTRDSIQAVRSMSFSVPLVYFIALGIYLTFKKVKSRLISLVIIGCYVISFIYYSDLYLNHSVKKSPTEYLYGYQNALNFVIANQLKYKQIYFTNYYNQPYIFYLFFSKYSPTNYQKTALLVENKMGDTGEIKKIDNIEFTTPDWNLIKAQPGSLGVFSLEEIRRQGIDKKEEFKSFIPLSPINGNSTFYAYQNP